MHSLKLFLCSLPLLCVMQYGFAENPITDSITFTVTRNGYTGFLQLNEDVPEYIGNDESIFTCLPNENNACSLNTGATYEDVITGRTGYIIIYFNSEHKISGVVPEAAAAINNQKTGIILHTSIITIHPKRYKYTWYTTSMYESAKVRLPYKGKQKITLINGISYVLLGGQDASLSQCGKSYPVSPVFTGNFIFGLHEDGIVEVHDFYKTCASAKSNKLLFKTSKITIDPEEISEGNELCYVNGNETIKINKPTSLRVIRGTVGFVEWYNDASQLGIYYFLPL